MSMKQTKTERWRLQIVWSDPKRANIDENIWDLQETGDGWIKAFKVDRPDEKGQPHMTYENYPKDAIKQWKLIELTRPEESKIVVPEGMIRN